MGSGGGKGATTSQSTSAPPPEVMAQYEKLMGRANEVASTPYQQYQGPLVAGFTPTQEKAFNTVDQAQGIAQPYFDAAKGYAQAGAAPITAQQIQNYQNPYNQQVVSATLGNLKELNAEQQANVVGGGLNSGGLFNDRTGVAQAELARQQGIAEAPTIAGLNQAGWTQALNQANADRAASAGTAFTMGNLGTSNLQDILAGASAQLGTGGLQQQLQQQQFNVPYQQFQQAQAFPYQQTSWLSGLSTGLGSQMGGTSSTVTTPPPPSAASYAGLGLGMMAMLNRGGRAERPGFDEGGGLGEMAEGIPAIPYAGVSSYIPTGIQLTRGSGPPKPPGSPSGSSGNPMDKVAQNAMGLGEKKGSLQKGISDIGNFFGAGDPSIGDAQQAGLDAGLSADEIGLGDIGAFRRGGRANGIYLPDHMRRHYDVGGDVGSVQSYGDDAPSGFPLVQGYGDDRPSGVGLAELAVAPASTDGFAKSSWLGSLDPSGLAASPSRAPTWPGEEPTSQPVGLAPQEVNPVAASPVAVSDRRGSLSPGSTVVDIERAKRAIGTFESGNNYQSVGPPTHLGRALGRYQVMEKELPGQLRQSGLPPMSSQEFLHDPAAQDQLFETVFGGLMKKHGNFNDAASIWFSGRPVAQAGNARDVLGTTVPQYLANTNAILARDDGVVPTYGSSAGRNGLAGQRYAFAPNDTSGHSLDRSAVASDDASSGDRGHLFSPETRNALMKAGFALMATRSPYGIQALGESGLAGLGAYQEAKRYGAQQAQEERKLNLSEKQITARIGQLEQARKNAEERINLATKAQADAERRHQDLVAHQQKSEEAVSKREERIANRPPPNYQWVDENDRSKGVQPIKNGPADPTQVGAIATAKKTPGGEELLDDVTMKRTAAQYNLIGGQALTNLGRGAQSAAVLKQIRQEAARQDEEAGITPQQRVQIQAETLGNRAAQRTLSTQEARMGAAGFEAEGAIKLARPIIQQMDKTRTTFLPFNKLIVGFQNQTLNPDQRELATRLQGVVNTYGAVMSRGANVVTDAARHRGEELLDSAFDAPSLNRILDTMQSEIDMAKNSPDQMRQFYMQKYGNKAVESGGTSTPATGGASTTAPPAKAIEMLKSNPALKGAFDQKYGSGAAERVLGAP